MITVNNIQFAPNTTAFVSTLSKPGGTACGIAKRRQKRIDFYTPQGKLFATLGQNRHGPFFVSASTLEDGRTWYMHTLRDEDATRFGVQHMGLVELDRLVRDVLKCVFPEIGQ